jgi:hypothetical protein
MLSDETFTPDAARKICSQIDKLIKLAESFRHKNEPLSRARLKKFVDGCFQKAIEQTGAWDYQARAAITGAMFEEVFSYIMEKLFDATLTRNYPMPEVGMPGGKASADFVILKRKAVFGECPVVCVIEAKGSATAITKPNGTVEKMPRPALERSDTVKKAICNAYLVKRGAELGKLPKNVKFFIVTNVKPSGGTCESMCKLAEGDVVDKIFDIENPKELLELVAQIKKWASE